MKKTSIIGEKRVYNTLFKKSKRLDIDILQLEKDCKRTDLTPEQKTRLGVISMAVAGVHYLEIAEKHRIHRMTITEWLHYYNDEGLEGLKRPIKPIKKTVLDIDELKTLLQGSNEKDTLKLNALIELVVSGNTDETANKYNMTPQGLLKWKREYLAKKFPLSQFW